MKEYLTWLSNQIRQTASQMEAELNPNTYNALRMRVDTFNEAMRTCEYFLKQAKVAEEKTETESKKA